MFGPVGGSEFILILALALLLFGPRKLPQIGKSLGRALAEFRGATNEFKASLQREVELEEVKEAGSGLASAGREVKDALNETARLGVARGSIEEPGPAARPTTKADGEGEGESDSDGEQPQRS
jgi:TatA/E family protein of Tat protein translocase